MDIIALFKGSWLIMNNLALMLWPVSTPPPRPINTCKEQRLLYEIRSVCITLGTHIDIILAIGGNNHGGI